MPLQSPSKRVDQKQTVCFSNGGHRNFDLGSLKGTVVDPDRAASNRMVDPDPHQR
jgi:hypothetical protein